MIGTAFLALLGAVGIATAQQTEPQGGQSALGAPPPASAQPKVEFAFEFRVTLAPVVVLGNSPFGHRQYIPITGGTIAGPKLAGEVLSGGWDYQLGLADGCTMLSADYFIRAAGGAIIHVLNEGMSCRPDGSGAARSFFRPRFEAPKGPFDWLTRGTFVASLEIEPPAHPTSGSAPPALSAIRLKFYQVE